MPSGLIRLSSRLAPDCGLSSTWTQRRRQAPTETMSTAKLAKAGAAPSVPAYPLDRASTSISSSILRC